MRKMFVILLLALCLLLPLAASAEGAITPLDLEYYQAAAEETAPDQANVQFVPYENPVDMIHLDDSNTDYWMYTFYLKETHGVPVTITSLQETVFDQDGAVQDCRYYVTEDMLDWGADLELKDGQVFEYGMRFDDWPQLGYVGYLMEGVDANGNQMAIHGLMELSHEYAPVWTVEEFQQQPEQEGVAAMRFTLDDDQSVYLMEVQMGSSAMWMWECQPSFENTGDTAFTLVGMDMVLFNGESMYWSRRYSPEAAADLFEMESLTVNPGESYSYSTRATLDSINIWGQRLYVMDENGTEMSFVAWAELLPEMEQK